MFLWVSSIAFYKAALKKLLEEEKQHEDEGDLPLGAPKELNEGNDKS
jgi:hypothetical protein